MSRKNTLASMSDDELVGEHIVQGANSHFVSEMLRRHKESSDALGKDLRRLTKWLLFFTVIIAALTCVLVVDIAERWWAHPSTTIKD